MKKEEPHVMKSEWYEDLAHPGQFREFREFPRRMPMPEDPYRSESLEMSMQKYCDERIEEALKPSPKTSERSFYLRLALIGFAALIVFVGGAMVTNIYDHITTVQIEHEKAKAEVEKAKWEHFTPSSSETTRLLNLWNKDYVFTEEGHAFVCRCPDFHEGGDGGSGMCIRCADGRY